MRHDLPETTPGPDLRLGGTAIRTPAEDQSYYLRRAIDHDRLADQSDGDGQRALHVQFATLYRARAEAMDRVQDDQ